MIRQTDTLALVGRILFGVPFLMSGFGKLAAPEATQGYIASVGLPAPVLAYLGAVAVELIGGALLIAGIRVRIVASVLAAFTLSTALFFHAHFADQNQMFHFLKNVCMVGGLLQIVAFGAGRFSLDARQGATTNLGSALSAQK